MAYRFVIILCLSVVSACSSTPKSNIDTTAIDLQWHKMVSSKNISGVAQDIELEDIELFSLPDHVINYLEDFIIPLEDEEDRYLVLRDWLYDQFLTFNYNSQSTATSTELFAARSINCLSFSILFVSAARYADLPAQLQLVYSPPFWDSKANTWIRNQHVNVATELKISGRSYYNYQEPENVYIGNTGNLTQNYLPPSSNWSNKKRKVHVMDLNPAVVSVPYKTRALKDNQAKALYYANKSVEQLLNDELPSAFAFLILALKTDRYSGTAWNNLGILYKKIGDFQLAKTSFEMTLITEPENSSAKINLLTIYRELGETLLAQALAEEIEKYRDTNPYHHFALGENNFQRKNYYQAIQHFEKAIEKKHNEHQFYYALARCYAVLGKPNKAQHYLSEAKNHASRGEQVRYSKKLQRLKVALSSRLD